MECARFAKDVRVHMMRYILYIALLIFMPAGGSSSTFANRWDEVRKSTVYIYFDVTDPSTGAKTAVQGTGFVVSRLGYVLTASHLLRDWNRQSKPDKEQNPIRASLGDKPGYVSSSPLNLAVINPGSPDSEDVALLKLPDPDRNAAQGYSPAPLCMASAQEATMGDAILAFGFPLGQNIQPVPGILGTKNAEGGRWAAAAAFAEGMSGGPVYHSSGNLIGLVKGGLANAENAANPEDTEAVRWITPIRHAENLLRIAGVSQDCPNTNSLVPSNITVMTKTTPSRALEPVVLAKPGFKTIVERISIASVLLIVDSNTGNPIAHAFVSVINPRTGDKVDHGRTDANGEFPLRLYAGQLRINVKHRPHQDLAATLNFPNQDQLRVVLPMANRCLAKK